MNAENTKSNQEYDAFISYKHEKRDVAIATAIQSDLEHFRVPRAIRKKTGRKNIGRIFRDKDELSLTDDLSDEIQSALLNSEFLIVVCSPHTRGSIWVEREVTFFLKTHDVKHVLTVITEGEPADVLPPVLLDQEKEPLSADYRLSKKEARRRELPRIAASLLGCGYDDLVQRSQQYRTRRIMAVMAVIAAAGVAASLYFFWSRTQIAESLRQARRNQVQYLSTEVESLLEKDQDVTAAQLALHTVPEDKKDTPAQSWRALADASGAYIPEEKMNPDAHVRTIGELHSADTIYKIRENKSGNRICTADATNHIHVWDAKRRKDRLSFQEEEKVSDLILMGNRLIVAANSHIYGYDLANGKRIWTIDRNARFSSLSLGHDMLQTDKTEKKLFALNFDVSGEMYLSNIDPSNGTIQSEIALEEAGMDSATGFVISDDGIDAALDGIDASLTSYIWLCNLTTGTVNQTQVSLKSIEGIGFLENGNLLVSGMTSDQFTDENGANNGKFYTMMTAGKSIKSVYCISPKSGKTLWTSDIQSDQYSTLPTYRGSYIYKCY